MMQNDNNFEEKQMNKQEDKGILKYGLMMGLCCLLPIIIIAGFPLFGIKGGALSSLLFLLCPLMHIGMFFMMRKNGHNGACHSNEKHYNSQVENKA